MEIFEHKVILKNRIFYIKTQLEEIKLAEDMSYVANMLMEIIQLERELEEIYIKFSENETNRDPKTGA